jgi:putative endonuclease
LKSEEKYWVYILENPQGGFYIGSTGNIDNRIARHNAEEKSGEKFTHKHGPWLLVWKEQHPSRSSAMKREKQIKAMKSSKWIREELLKKEAEINFG